MGIFRGKKKRIEIVLNSEFFKTLYDIVDQREGEGIEDSRIAYAGRENRQYLEVTVESFCQEDLRRNYRPNKWRYGFLVPEQDNQFDSNAIAVYLSSPEEESSDGEFGVYRVGYLKKELARRVSSDIANLLVASGVLIPVLAMVEDKAATDNFAVVAYAMTDTLSFAVPRFSDRI